jgi:hypothetical protein
MDNFGSFILNGISQVMLFLTLCLPPIQGECTDYSNDTVWIQEQKRMEAALNETTDVIQNTTQELANWVSKIQGRDLERFVADKDTKSKQEDINAIVTNIMNFLRDQQPYFDTQVFVATMNDSYKNGRDIHCTGCDKDKMPDCETRMDDTGHFWFNDIQGLTISVHYRYIIKKGFFEGLGKFIKGFFEILGKFPFPKFFQFMISTRLRLGQTGNLNLALDIVTKLSSSRCERPLSNKGPFIYACMVLKCIECSKEEQIEFD